MKSIFVAIFFMMISGSALANDVFCDAYDYAAAITPEPPARSRSLREISDSARQPVKDTLLIGDSLFRRWPAENMQLYLGKSIANFGISSDATENILWRLDAIKKLQPSPSRIILWVGSNDLASEDKTCAITYGLGYLLQRVRENWPDAPLYVLPIIPRGSELNQRDTDRVEVNKFLSGGRLRWGYTFVDVDPLVLCQVPKKDWRVTMDAASPQPETKYCGLYISDGVHLTPDGYARVGRALQSALGSSTPAQ